MSNNGSRVIATFFIWFAFVAVMLWGNLPSNSMVLITGIMGVIAAGSTSEVFRAKSVGIAGFEKLLAVKRIRPRLASEPGFVRSFVDAARIAVALNHRNILQVFDFGKADGELYVAMELVDGIDLSSAIARAAGRNIGLPLSVACAIAGDVASALDYAHRKSDSQGRPLGIVHCNIAPAKVMLSRDGFVKLLDFGIARSLYLRAAAAKRRRGDPRHLAPEQTRGDSPSGG